MGAQNKCKRIDVPDTVEEIVFNADRERLIKATFKRTGKPSVNRLLKITRRGRVVLV